MKKFKSILGLFGLLGSTIVFGQTNPLWEDYDPRDVVVESIGDDTLEPLQAFALQASSVQTLSVPETISAEIADLAAALDNDPVRIFNYVRNTIDYEHYFGLCKGAELTLLEGGGNDFDQCELLAKLLTAAGHTNYKYRLRGHRLDYSILTDWFGLAEEPYPGMTYEEAFGQTITEAFPNGIDKGVGDDVAKQASHAGSFIATRGSRRSNNGAPAAIWYPTFPQKASVVFDRLWIQLTIDGSTYNLDPSYKTYERIDGLDDLLSSIGYSRSQLLSDAGGTIGTGYVKSLDSGNVDSYLAARTQATLDYLELNYSGLTVSELVGGRRLVKKEITNLNDAFPLASIFWGTNLTWDSIPDSYKTKVRLRSGAMDYTIPTSDLKGRKIGLTFSDNIV